MRFVQLYLMLLFLLTQSVYAQSSVGIQGVDIITDQKVKTNIVFNEKESSFKFSVIIFLSARCPCSNSHIDELKDLSKKYHSTVQFVAVHSNQNETQEEAKIYFKKQNLNFPIISDSGAKIADEFKAFKTPHVFVLNQKAEIIYRGGVSSSQHFSPDVKKYLREVLEDIVDGKSPRHTETRSLGCVILRKS